MTGRTALLTLSIIALFSADALAQERAVRLQDIDLNKDGVASPEETQIFLDKVSRARSGEAAAEKIEIVPTQPAGRTAVPRLNPALQPYDLNGDGVLSEQEKAAYVQAEQAQAAKKPVAPKKKMTMELPPGIPGNLRRDYEMRLQEMQTLDANGDGILQASELTQAPAAKFTAGDVDGDGQLSTQERAAMLGKIEQGDAKEGGSLAKQRAGRIENRYKNADANKDGLLSKDEYGSYFGTRYRNFDRDGDGTVSVEEYRTDGEKLPSYYNRAGTKN